MAAPRKYPDELRERAVRLVFEAREQGESHGAIARIADKLGVHREALRNWVRQAEVDDALSADRRFRVARDRAIGVRGGVGVSDHSRR